MEIWSVLVLVEEQIQVYRLIKIEAAVVFYQFLISLIVCYAIYLEQHHVWRSANPLLHDFPLALPISHVPFYFWPSASIPGLVKITFFNS